MRSSTYRALSIPRLRHLMMLLVFIRRVKVKILVGSLPLGCGGQRVDATQTLKFLSKRKLLRKPGSLLLQSRLCRSLIMPYFHVESYAFSKLKKIAIRCSIFVKASLMKVSRQTT